MKLKTLGILAFVFIVFMLLFQNKDVVTLHFLFLKMSMSLIILIPFLSTFGFIFGFWFGRKS